MPELWNAVTGTIFRSANWKRSGRSYGSDSVFTYSSVFVNCFKKDSGSQGDCGAEAALGLC